MLRFSAEAVGFEASVRRATLMRETSTMCLLILRKPWASARAEAATARAETSMLWRQLPILRKPLASTLLR